jgi:4-hydroxy-4-methyl-2-oxoglutarate aldolase
MQDKEGPAHRMSDLTERLSRCYTGAVYDVLRARGHADCVLPRTIRALDPDTKVAGPVFTVRGRPNPNLTRDASLLRWTEVLSTAPAGHVVVCQPNDDERALMGELSAETLQYRGVRGYIVDGGSRDNAMLRRLGFPVFCRFQSPRDIVAAWSYETMGEPITIGEVAIATGDYVLADIDGITIIPGRLAEEVVAEVLGVMETENEMRSAILSGMDPKAAYLKFGKF